MKYWMIYLLMIILVSVHAQGFDKLDTVLMQLHMDKEKCEMDLFTFHIWPNDTSKVIVVIPEIVENDDDFYSEYNSHILIIEKETGEIKSRFFESSETNGWYSDAINMDAIYFDTNLYDVSTENKAFGIKVVYSGNSGPNPYSYETISLFIENDTSMIQLLKNYDMNSSAGEWDMICAGEFTEKSKALLVSENQTNDFYDIVIETKIRKLKTFIDDNEDCAEKETLSNETQILKFVDEVYK